MGELLWPDYPLRGSPASQTENSSGARKGAHRGDSVKRDMDVVCFNCGKTGHKASYCKAGKSTGGKVEGALKDAVDQADGAKIAASELLKDNAEMKERIHGLEKAEKELGLLRQEAVLEAQRQVCSLNFEVGWWHFPRWAVVLLFVPIPIWLILTMFWGLTFTASIGAIGVVERDLFYANCILYGICTCSWAVFAATRWGGISLTWWKYRRVRFVRLAERDLTDRRHDANSLQTLRHADSLSAIVSVQPYTRWWRARETEISAELLAQLTAPKYMSLSGSDSIIWERMVRGVETSHLVNMDRYRMLNVGYSIQMSTVLVAYLLRAHQMERLAKVGFTIPAA